MRTFTYKRWSGGGSTVQAAAVEFGPAHVVFYDQADRIVLAERVEQVNQLREIEEIPNP